MTKLSINWPKPDPLSLISSLLVNNCLFFFAQENDIFKYNNNINNNNLKFGTKPTYIVVHVSHPIPNLVTQLLPSILFLFYFFLFLINTLYSIPSQTLLPKFFVPTLKPLRHVVF